LKESLKKNKTYGEYVSDELPRLIDEYVEEGKNPEEIRSRITTFLQNKMLDKLSQRPGNPGVFARTYIASQQFLAGASSDKAVASVRSLERMESYVFSQNDLYSPLSDYIKKGKKSDWKLEMSGSTITVRNPKTKSRVSLSINIGKNGGVDYYAVTNAPRVKELSKKSLVESTGSLDDYIFTFENIPDVFLNLFDEFIRL